MDLRSVMKGVPEYLNGQNIRTTIGLNNLRLSKRSVSDILEKWVMDFLLSRHREIIRYKPSSGYDFAIESGDEHFFVNIKTESGSQRYSWLCSSSVLSKQKAILDRLYFYKLTYVESDGIVRVDAASIAGPMNDLIESKRVVTYEKGEPLPRGIRRGELPTHYNGEHCFLGQSSFKQVL